MLVIGAGLSGLMAAVCASASGARVTLLEKQDLPGRKYLMAGMGSGALSNTGLSLGSFHGRESRFAADALAAFDRDALRAWFAAEGVAVTDGPHYGLMLPTGGPDAALAALAGALGDTELLSEARATSARRSGDQFQVTLDDGRKLKARRLILACGGPNLRQIGGESTGLEIAAKLGHELAPSHPAHVPLEPADAWLAELAGLWMDVRLTLKQGNHEIAQSEGSMLFARGALTGEAVFNLTLHAAAAIADNPGLTLSINFFPELEHADVEEWLYRTLGGHTQLPAREALDHMLPRQIGDRLLARQNVKPAARCRQIEKREREGLLAEMTGLAVTITGTLGQHAAEYSVGGVRLRDINPRTMESRITPGLYVVGQMLDVLPDWGGAVQHFSLASGFVAGREAGRGLDSGLGPR